MAEAPAKCVPCEGGAIEAMTGEAVQSALSALPWWTLESGAGDRLSIVRAFQAKNFVEAMAFLNRVAQVAEAEGHHPDIHITSYREVKIELYTHSVGGVTENDLILARRIDTLPVVYSKSQRQALEELEQSRAQS
eukprot:TRINITY_DN1439_c0_g1_i1.p1 TRINITY_DN1439_c0_g1~~TRINITY_DN1439_c0_g1_i1.p1  ORF type:complete len:135 (-),score=12.36 TRINITY_DN1439_c0_g1_i1:231-635(-)